MKTDEKTLKLIEEVRRRKAEIASAENSNWITNCSFAFEEGNSKTINLHVESNVQKLIKIAAFLRSREAAYISVAKELNLNDAPKFMWDGYEVKDWLQDIRTRISKSQIAANRKKLEVLENRLNAVISPELKTQMELDEIDKLLSE